jgi:hypothetical protein
MISNIKILKNFKFRNFYKNKKIIYSKMESNNNESNQTEKKIDKVSAPKRKYCIIHGYNGHGFSGNQKYIYSFTIKIEILM